MILQALKQYYDRKADEEGSEVPLNGFEWKDLPFLIVIDRRGNFINLEDTRETHGKSLKAKRFLLPRSVARSGKRSYEKTNFLWDHIGYVLGEPRDNSQKDKELAAKQHESWLAGLRQLKGKVGDGAYIEAILKFYERNGVSSVKSTSEFVECQKIPGCNITFRLKSETVPIPSSTTAREYIMRQMSMDGNGSNEDVVTCLVTGEEGPIARIHGSTPITKDSRVLISFQKGQGYDSYGKQQGANAPIIRSTEFAYTTALNMLLKSGNQRMLVGDSHTVFWASKESNLEHNLASFFQEPERLDPDSGASVVRELFDSVKSGAYIKESEDPNFYVLGLSPNAARIAVRFWEPGKVSVFSQRIKQYFDDFAIIGGPKDPEYYSLQSILKYISPRDDKDRLPPSVAGDLMRSILGGTAYPSMLLQLALNRIRADTDYRVKRVRAATIKAYLNRYYEFNPDRRFEEIKMALDKDQQSTGYHVGRLFATLERIQEKASPNLNATIRQRYYGAACTSPESVFPTLLRLKNHHLAKIDSKGMVIWFEKTIGEILSNIGSFPNHMDLHEQGMFAIGYYHQRQNFYSGNAAAPEHEMKEETRSD